MDGQQYGQTNIWMDEHTHMSTEGHQDERTDGHKGQKYGWTDTWTDGLSRKRDFPSKKALSMFLHEENLL